MIMAAKSPENREKNDEVDGAIFETLNTLSSLYNRITISSLIQIWFKSDSTRPILSCKIFLSFCKLSQNLWMSFCFTCLYAFTVRQSKHTLIVNKMNHVIKFCCLYNKVFDCCSGIWEIYSLSCNYEKENVCIAD